MKFHKPLLLISIILVLDQIIKIWIKTNMYIGEEFPVLGNWFLIHFTENNGMAFGMEFAGENGKIILSILRIAAVIGLGWYLINLCKREASKGLIFSLSLILAGALGNIFDTAFYGVVFGYEQFLYGKVVDMFYFPVIESQYPNWFPFWGGQDLIFFRPVFNIADASITVGVFNILLFQKSFFVSEMKNQEEENAPETEKSTHPPEEFNEVREPA